jgi:outer membrane protein
MSMSMRTIWSRALIGTVLLRIALPVAAAAQEQLDLAACVGLALEHHPTIQRAERDLAQSRIQVRQASAQLLPTVGVGGGFSRYTSVSPQRLLNPATNQIVEGSATAITTMSYYTGLSVSQTLFNRSVSALYAQAVAAEATAASAADLSRQQLILQVYQAYFNLLRARRNLEVAAADLAYNEGLLEQVRTLRQIGSRAEVDVLRQESALAQARQRMIAATNNDGRSRAELNYLIGHPVTEVLAVVDELEPDGGEITLQEALDRAAASHPLLRQADLGVSSARSGVEAAAAGRWPSVSLSGNYSWRGDNYLDIGDAFSKDYTWSVGVSLSVPVFDGLRTRLNTARAHLALEGARQDRGAALQSVERDVYRAVLDLEESRQSLETARQAVQLAGEALRLSEELYRLGSGTLLEVNASQLDQVNARYQEVQALFNLKVARAALDFAVGELQPSPAH